MGASSLELKTGASIMAIGGYVADREVRYFIAGEPFGPPGRRESGTAAQITSWVKQNFAAVDVDGATVYDLAAPIA